jgi:hypothetical protein
LARTRAKEQLVAPLVLQVNIKAQQDKVAVIVATLVITPLALEQPLVPLVLLVPSLLQQALLAAPLVLRVSTLALGLAHATHVRLVHTLVQELEAALNALRELSLLQVQLHALPAQLVLLLLLALRLALNARSETMLLLAQDLAGLALLVVTRKLAQLHAHLAPSAIMCQTLVKDLARHVPLDNLLAPQAV